jgi:hypothetical protein
MEPILINHPPVASPVGLPAVAEAQIVTGRKP